MTKTKTDMINEALSWYGTPCGPGALKGQSCSCIGLLVGISRNMGLSAKLTEQFLKYEYRLRPEDGAMVLLKLRKVLILGDTNNIEPLDVVVTKTMNYWHHVGLMLKNNNVIESDDRYKKVIYRRLTKKPSLVLKIPEIQNWPD